MIIAEFIVICAGLVTIGLGTSMFVSMVKRTGVEITRKHLNEDLMQHDLCEALRSRDHRQIDDWLTVYAGKIDRDVYTHVKTRRDELWLEANP